jgi:hypothetical protein
MQQICEGLGGVAPSPNRNTQSHERRDPNRPLRLKQRVLAEVERLLVRQGARELDALVRLLWPDWMLHFPLLGLLRVEVDGPHFTPAPGAGRWAVVLAVHAGAWGCFTRPEPDPSEVIDFVAFDPREPSQRWLLLGVADFLGGDLLRRAVNWDEQLRVFASPLAWLRGRGEGVVPLTDDLEQLREVQAGLLADDDDHAATIRAGLTKLRRVPRILVPR